MARLIDRIGSIFDSLPIGILVAAIYAGYGWSVLAPALTDGTVTLGQTRATTIGGLLILSGIYRFAVFMGKRRLSNGT